jgi:hypothetical protein
MFNLIRFPFPIERQVSSMIDLSFNFPSPSQQIIPIVLIGLYEARAVFGQKPFPHSSDSYLSGNVRIFKLGPLKLGPKLLHEKI